MKYKIGIFIFIILLFFYNYTTNLNLKYSNPVKLIENYKNKHLERITLYSNDYNLKDSLIIPSEMKSNIDEQTQQNQKLVNLITIPNDEAEQILSSYKFTDSKYVYKNISSGVILLEENNIFNISAHNNYFTIDGYEGTYLVNNINLYLLDIIRKYANNIDLSSFKKYNKLIMPKDSIASPGHIYFAFEEEELFVLCSCDEKSYNIDSWKLFEVAKLKYDQNIKLHSYYMENDNKLSLLYEDGTYIEWNQLLYTVTALFNLSEVDSNWHNK